MYALYVYLIHVPYMYALCVCLICMPYMYALCVCLICMPYVYALYVCLVCMPYMYALCLAVSRCRLAVYTVRATQKEKTDISIPQNVLVLVAFSATMLYQISFCAPDSCETITFQEPPVLGVPPSHLTPPN